LRERSLSPSDKVNAGAKPAKCTSAANEHRRVLCGRSFLFISRFNFGCGTIFRLANRFLVVCQTALSSRNAQNLSFSFFRFSLRCLSIRSRYKLTDKSLNFMSVNQCFSATFQNSANFSKPVDSSPVATLQSCE
jgi:hypothetical protein